MLEDLKQRDMLKDTLVIWAGEFGRTPHGQNGDGRDHNAKGYTTWMAGGGVKGGFSFGSTDEYGYEAFQTCWHISCEASRSTCLVSQMQAAQGAP